jgi:hypothetical protein
MHAVGQQSTVETLTTVAMATDKHATMDATSFFCGLTPACTQQSKELLFSTGSGPAQQCGSVLFGV